jgi:hypothetical protein
MNMEDRLREAFEQEAEQLHAPHGSPETAIRRGRRRRASNLIGGAALVLTLVGGTAAGVQLLGNTDEPAEENLTSAVETDQTVDESITGTPTAGVVDFGWEKVILPNPDGTDDVWNIQVVATEHGFVAVGTGYTPTVGESILVWRSTDGTDWTLASTSSPFDAPVDTLLTTGDGFVAIVRSYDGSVDSTSIYTSPDGAAWAKVDVDLGSLLYNQYLWFAGAASGDGATVIAGVLQTEPDEPPAVFEEAGVALQQNNRDGSFTVTDLATGEVITVISNEDVYGRGPTVRGPDGEEIVALSQEVVEGAHDDDFEGVLTIEQDGIRVELDYNQGLYTATDIASETLIIEGPLDALWEPPRITIVHPDTGETILDVDIDEFYQAQDDAWNGGSEYRPESEILVLATIDGTTWNRIELAAAAGEEVGLGGVSFGPEGFLLTTLSYGPDRARQQDWRSADGQNWEVVASVDEPGDGSTISAGGAYYRLGYGNRAAISRSPDGVTWTPVYSPAGRGTYYSLLAAGDLGVVAIGQEQDEYYGPPVVIAKDGRTLVVDGETGRITVTDDATGEVLTTIELDVYQEEAPAQIIEDTEAGTIAITDLDGNIVMEFTEEEANAASEESARDYEYSEPKTAIAFSYDGEEWFTATTVGLEVAWPQSVAVGDDAVVIIGESYYAPDSIDYPTDPGGTTDSTAVSGMYLDSSPGETYVWVGRPR